MYVPEPTQEGARKEVKPPRETSAMEEKYQVEPPNRKKKKKSIGYKS